jgi:hypothetical protein
MGRSAARTASPPRSGMQSEFLDLEDGQEVVRGLDSWVFASWMLTVSVTGER